MRDIISKNEGTLTLLQIIGFLIIVFGVVVITISSFLPVVDEEPVIPSVVSVSFFVTMLGFALAFPSLLEGNEGLSTMRIIVFMITNVICMLLLKIGWSASNLEDIHLDQYWLGVIAFVFGAKATQSFFESKMAVPKVVSKEGMEGVPFSKAEIAKLAVTQNKDFLKVKFPNIASISDAVNDLSKEESHVIAIYLKDNNSVGIPDKLTVLMPDGTKKAFPTEIIKNTGSGKIHISQLDNISQNNEIGSICCLIETKSNEKKVVTAGHIYSEGTSKNYGGELYKQDQAPVSVNGLKAGQWYFQVINYKTDIGLATIENLQTATGFKSFAGKQHYEVKDSDVKKTKVKVLSHASNPQERYAYIIDYNTAWDVPYMDKEVLMSNIIIIGNEPDRENCQSVSIPGDSGGCVYEPDTGDLVGLILGGNNKFTWVLSIKEILETYNYKLT